MKNPIAVKTSIFIVTRDFGYFKKQLDLSTIIKVHCLPQKTIYLIEGCKRPKSLNKIRRIMNHKLRNKAKARIFEEEGVIGYCPTDKK